MNDWLNWAYIARAVGLLLIGFGLYWHDDIVIGAGVAVAFAPEGTGLKNR
jgi:hypothetical protein